jgi:DNA-binding NtrC family response regulator
MTKERILVVDDDTNHLKVLTGLLAREGFDALTAPDVDTALPLIEQQELNLIITDLKMPGKSGIDLLALVRELKPMVPVIVVTAHGDIDTAVAAMKLGAFDFIVKPVNEHELLHAVDKALAEFSLNTTLLTSYFSRSEHPLPDVIGTSSAIQQVLQAVIKIAPTDSTVLITGETGTGKEVIAKAIHAASLRKDRPFVKVNCAAIPESLAESELFGYERGAFTGAQTSKPGRFELAHEGTIFLDEIGDMPFPIQTKLLTVLQDKQIERVGGVRTVPVDARVIAATNHDLQARIKAGSFRADLFYRLNVVPIHLPPLRERPDDIAPLTRHFLNRSAGRLRKPAPDLQPAVLAALTGYDWPGNIRELEHVIERMVLMTEGGLIGIEHLPRELLSPAPAHMPSALRELVGGITRSAEKQMIVDALNKTGQNRTKAAELLGISRRTLQNKIKEYVI